MGKSVLVTRLQIFFANPQISIAEGRTVYEEEMDARQSFVDKINLARKMKAFWA